MRRVASAVLGVLILAGGSASAHHGYANFFMDRKVTIQGVLEEVRFANPHVVLRLRTSDGTAYTALFHQGASWFRNREALFSSGPANPNEARTNYVLTPQSLKVGDRIDVVASPARDPSVHEVVSIAEVRRPADGWNWRRPLRWPPE
jgi:hypothetical protein